MGIAQDAAASHERRQCGGLQRPGEIVALGVITAERTQWLEL
jgi:hypothetical protein